MHTFKLVPGKTRNSFLVEHFSIEGTEVIPHKPLYPDVAFQSMYFAVDNEFDVYDYAKRHGLTFHSEYKRGRIHDTDGFITFKGMVGKHSCTINLITRDNVPMMVQVMESYVWSYGR